MTTALYPALTVALYTGGASIDLLGGSIRAIPVTAAYAPNFQTDNALDDVPAPARAAVAQVLASKTLTAGADGRAVFDADDLTFPGVPAGDPIVGLVLYLHTGTESTSRLVAYLDYFTNLPLTPDSRDVIFTWATDANKVFSV